MKYIPDAPPTDGERVVHGCQELADRLEAQRLQRQLSPELGLVLRLELGDGELPDIPEHNLDVPGAELQGGEADQTVLHLHKVGQVSGQHLHLNMGTKP